MIMQKFTYKAKKGPHEVVEGELTAENEEQAVAMLVEKGLVPVKVWVAGTVSKAAVKGRPGAPVSRREVMNFVRNLANFLNGNVPILKAMSALERQERKSGMKFLISDLTASVRDGLSLSQAFERHPEAFSPLLISMVRGGESGGVLGKMMEKLVEHQAKEEDFRRAIRSALAYPIFIFAMGIVTVFVLLTYFLPRLLGVYLANQQELPWPTQVVMAVSGFLAGNWYWIVGLIVLIYAFSMKIVSRTARHEWLDRTKLKIPFLRSLIIRGAVMNFSRTLGLLLEHGVPISKGVPLAAATVGNSVISVRLSAVEQDLVIKGASLAASLGKISFFPPMAVDMISVGEQSGDLGRTFLYLADTYEKEVESVLKTSSSLIEPMLILVIGGIIGFIVFAMLMPVFQMDVMVG